MMTNKKEISEEYQKIGFFIIILLTGYLAFITTKQYLGMFFIAFVSTILLHPLYLIVRKKIKYELLAAFVTMIVFTVIIIVPLSIIGTLAINQGVDALVNIKENPSAFSSNIPLIDNVIKTTTLSPDETGAFTLEKILQETTSDIVSLLTSATLYIAKYAVKIFFDFGIFLLFLTFFLPEKENILTALKRITPLTDKEGNSFIDRFAEITKQLSISVLLIPVMQGFLIWLIFFILGIPGSLFWGVIAGLLSMLPVVGVSLVWLPATIILAAQSHWFSATVLGLYGLIVMNFSDNAMRAWLLKGEKTQVPELVTIISTIGGVFAFGFFGIFYGPIIVISFLALLDIYTKRLDKNPQKQTT